MRWSGECGCVTDGRWKAPLRLAFERLAAGIDAVTVAQFGALPGEPDPWAARDAYIDVVLGAEPSGSFAAHWVGSKAPVEARRTLLRLMEAQRWRLAMFSSDGWFWDDPMRPETRQVLRFAARAAQLADEIAGTDLERRLDRGSDAPALTPQRDGRRGDLPARAPGRGAVVARCAPTRGSRRQPASALGIRQPVACVPRADEGCAVGGNGER